MEHSIMIVIVESDTGLHAGCVHVQINLTEYVHVEYIQYFLDKLTWNDQTNYLRLV